MRPAISEFSFGYAVTEEIVRHQRQFLIGAPIFPSLIQEGRAGGGYDLQINRIGIPLFLQFKLSHKMVKNNSLEIKNHSLFTTPFFRMHLMPLKLSQQHNMLLALDNGSNEVYYIAPFFTTQSELNQHYSNIGVLNNCLFIKPSDIGILPDNEDHHISLEQHGTAAYLFSKEPKKVEGISYSQDFLSEIKNKVEKENESIDIQIDRLSKRMLGIINERIENKNDNLLGQLNNLPTNLGLLTYLARYYFDCEVIIAFKES